MGDKPDLPENKLRDFIQRNDKGKWTCDNNHNIKYFTEYELKSITRNYNSKLGNGAFGEVFKGVLRDGRPVAVKRYIHADSEEAFAKEVIVHSQINHKNVVRLVGCCIEKNAYMLVFEYVTNGNLNDHLHCGDTPMSLDTRLNIAIECAEALACMHSMYNPVLHGDIKPANILLDEKLHAKVSDFGISRLLQGDNTECTINVKGSIGYMDPALVKNGRLTPKSDVYSFGILLVELITKIKPTDKEKEIIERFSRFSPNEKAVQELFDADITSAGGMKVLECIGGIAKECMKEKIDDRPEMNYVAGRLQELRTVLKQAKEKAGAANLLKINGMTFQNINNIMTFSKKQLKNITNNFSTLLYEEFYGEVYLGALADNTRVAVKRPKEKTEEMKDLIINELIIQSSICHRNIIKLLGCCLVMDRPILVYEYAPNGSLQKYLFVDQYDLGKANANCLGLNIRYKIALGVARAMECLHKNRPEWVLHCNINPWSIRLDEHFCPKVSGFELSKMTSKEKMTFNSSRAAMGHAAPEWSVDGEDITAKADVYSYGMMLLEIITGRSNKEVRDSVFMDNWYCPKWVYEKVYEEQRMQDILDERVVPVEAYIDPQSMAMVERMAKTAIWCIQSRPVMRPSMDKVIKMLQGTVDITKPPKPYILSGLAS
ncbi:hypothetical protein EJB05_23021, partial [Eragrostis curvula]